MTIQAHTTQLTGSAAVLNDPFHKPPIDGGDPLQAIISAESLSDTIRVDGNNLGLVLDVELNVLLRFGQRQLSLREVLDLKCGSVIELDHLVDEPVELLLDGRVIARGEAAIVDGNYGLRVTEIVQPCASIQAGH
jgi:flagellar motor switch protein FliN/FliY